MIMKIRAKNTGPNSPVGQYRRETYEYCISQYDKAIDCGFYIEAVAITESLIADRLEARRSFLFPDVKDKQKFSGIGKLKDDLENDLNGVVSTFGEIEKWMFKRGNAIHQIAKVEEGDFSGWEEKYASIKETAESGFILFREIDGLVRKLNKPPKNKSAGEY